MGLWGAVPGCLAEGTQLEQRGLVHRWVCAGEVGAPGIVTSHVLSCECAPRVQALLWEASSKGAAQRVCVGGAEGEVLVTSAQIPVLATSRTPLSPPSTCTVQS